MNGMPRTAAQKARPPAATSVARPLTLPGFIPLYGFDKQSLRIFLFPQHHRLIVDAAKVDVGLLLLDVAHTLGDIGFRSWQQDDVATLLA